MKQSNCVLTPEEENILLAKAFMEKQLNDFVKELPDNVKKLYPHIDCVSRTQQECQVCCKGKNIIITHILFLIKITIKSLQYIFYNCILIINILN